MKKGLGKLLQDANIESLTDAINNLAEAINNLAYSMTDEEIEKQGFDLSGSPIE